MKTQILFFIILFFFTGSIGGYSQNKVSFEYDAAGNRISGRTISMLRAAVEEEEEETPTNYSEVLSERVIRIYPNPTKGLLKIDIENTAAGEKAWIGLFDLAGRHITIREGVTGSTELDITSQADGVYILKIVIGEEQSEWKVIKQ